MIDEVQRVPELLTVVHQLMEEPGGPRFVLTGSSARKLKRTGVDLLAGRAVVRSMHPFIAAELGDRFDLDSALGHGLLPLIWDADDPADTLSAYAGMYVQQEVQAEGLVRDLGAFHRFLEANQLLARGRSQHQRGGARVRGAAQDGGRVHRDRGGLAPGVPAAGVRPPGPPAGHRASEVLLRRRRRVPVATPPPVRWIDPRRRAAPPWRD